MSKQSFIKGTLILLAAGIVTRVLGFVPRIALPRLIGAEGVGLYQLVWPFLSVVLTIVVGGIPLAVSKLVAQAEAEGNERRGKAILRVTIALTLTVSVALSLVCLAAGRWVTTTLYPDDRVYNTFLAMIPIIPIIAVSAVLRGYFQGLRNMIPSASSQIVETIVRIAMMLVFSFALMPYGLAYSAAGAMLGVFVGEIAGFIILMLHLRGQHGGGKKPSVKPPAHRSRERKLLRDLLPIALPVTGSRLVGASSYFLESILTLQGLAAAGIVTAVATAQYGALQGMVVPILLLPSALTASLTVSLIPSLSEAAALKDMTTVHARIHQSMRLALISGAPFALIMFVLADPLCMLLYNQPQAGMMLQMMAPIALFIYMQAPLQAALQALDHPGTAFVNSIIGAAVKLLLIVLLVRQPEIGIKGAIIASNANIVLVTTLHLLSARRLLKFKLHAGETIKIMTAVIASGLSCYAIMQTAWTTSAMTRFWTSIVVALVVYFAMLIILRLISREDMSRLTRLGRKIIKT